MRAFVLGVVVSAGFLALSVRAMRRKRLREQTALLWLLVSTAMLVLALTLPWHVLDWAAHVVGIAYPPDLLLLVAVLFLVVLVFHLSLRVDRLSERQTTLIQELALAQAREEEAARRQAEAAGLRAAPEPDPPQRP